MFLHEKALLIRSARADWSVWFWIGGMDLQGMHMIATGIDLEIRSVGPAPAERIVLS